MYNEKFGAVREFYIAQIEVDYIGVVAEKVVLAALSVGSFGGYGIGADILARNRREETAHYRHKPDAARVDDPRLFENGQKFGRLCKRLVAHFYQRVEEIDEILIPGGKLGSRLAHKPYDGKDSALLGYGHGAVRNLGARFESFCKRLCIEGILGVFEHRTDTAENLRRDNARISASAAERALGNRVAYFLKTVRRTGVHFLDRRLKGQGHIRSRIAVGNGEHVEGVNFRPVYF